MSRPHLPGLRWAICVLLFSGSLLVSAPAHADARFATWLEGLHAEALERGIKRETLDAALRDIEPIPRVVELDRKQPEFTLTFAQYLARVVPNQRVRRARALLAEHGELLREVSALYKVQPRFLVALWGIESDFGRLTGGFRVIHALASLAYDGRRSTYFRGELLNALHIVDQGHIAPEDMMGSWAGAMGQAQFMPSTFLNFAVDYDGDGRLDIWHSRPDVFASAANYLAKSGWRDDITWGRAVRLPPGFDRSLIGLETVKTLPEWQAAGVRRADGTALPKRPLRASLIEAEEGKGPAFLVYDNYRALLKWNRSTFFALAVGYLADKMRGG